MRAALLPPVLLLACAPGPPDDAPGPLPAPTFAPPEVVLGAPATVRVGAPATFDASASFDPQGYDLVDFAWSCDDGSAASGAVVGLQFSAPGPVRCTATVQSETGLQTSATAETTVRDGLADWTVLVFANGDNNLEDAALDDLEEMEQVGSSEAVQIIVQIDRARGYTSADGDWQGARRYRVEAHPEAGVGSTLLADLGEVDSGDPQTVIDFARAALADFPAERVALVIWNHGWGWSLLPDGAPAVTKGISDDEQSGNDLSIAEGEYAAVLAALVEERGQPLDLVGLDACLMASWEVAHAAAPHAGAMVASQDYEAEDGWPYDAFLADLQADPGMDALALGDRIALRFQESRDTTQSVTDLSALGDLDAHLDALALALLAEADGGGPRLRAAAQQATAFEYGGAPDRDLGQLLDALSGDDAVGRAAGEARQALDLAVPSNYTFGAAAAGASGLNIYAPTRGAVSEAWLGGAWVDASLWDELLLGAAP